MWKSPTGNKEVMHEPKMNRRAALHLKAARGFSMTYLLEACQILRFARKVNSGSPEAANRKPVIERY